jgi:bifunctional DNase/RNase
VVVDLHDNIFYAQITVDRDGQVLEIDSRTSDALALAVRTNAKIFVEEHVMEEAAIHPEKGLTLQSQEDSLSNAEEDENLEAFEDFIDTLDLDDLQ